MPSERFFAIVPAAGVGSRLGAGMPKQYLEIGGRTLLRWALSALIEARWIERILVVLAPDDRGAQAEALAAELGGVNRLRIAAVGGASRRDSVLAGLEALPADVGARDWVLVHDAARPALRLEDLERLRERLADHPVGGLLALPVVDTVKRADAAGRVAGTVERSGLWLAQTPQMFRHGLLREALRAHPDVTDEAAAMEAGGYGAALVEGPRRNFKVTTMDDFRMMSAILGSPER